MIKIGNYSIGETNAPFIIAEMSGNHNQSIERAFQIVDAAAKAGAHAIKLQTYTADTITVKGAMQIQDEGSLWKGRELYDLYSEAYTPWEWHKPIFDYAISLGLIAFSSPFDITAVDFLESLDVPAYKIASFENTDHILLKKVAQIGKPVIMSTGVSSISDIDESVQVLRDNGCKDLIILKCTSTYPSTPENTNLRAIPLLRQIYNTQVGLSDHTMGIGAAVASVTFGAVVIEKHFTLNKKAKGPDHASSLEPHELKNLVEGCNAIFLATRNSKKIIHKEEIPIISWARESVVAIENIKKNEILNKKNISVKRPAPKKDEIPAKLFFKIVGKKAKNNIKIDTKIKWQEIN
jgi:pseudaminic acid synthase